MTCTMFDRRKPIAYKPNTAQKMMPTQIQIEMRAQ